MQQDALCSIVWMWKLVRGVKICSEDTKHAMYWDRCVKTCSQNTKHPTWCVIMQNIVQKINRSSLRIKFQSQDYFCLHFLLLHQSIDNIHFKCSYDYVHNIFLWKHLCKLKHSHTSFAQSNRRHWRWALQGCTIRVALFCCVTMRMGLVCQKTFWLCKLRQMIFFVKET